MGDRWACVVCLVLLCQDIVKGVYTSILACLAAGSSATVRTLSVGFDLAGIIGKHLDHLFHKLVHENNIEIFRVTTHTAGLLYFLYPPCRLPVQMPGYSHL